MTRKERERAVELIFHAGDLLQRPEVEALIADYQDRRDVYEAESKESPLDGFFIECVDAASALRNAHRKGLTNSFARLVASRTPVGRA